MTGGSCSPVEGGITADGGWYRDPTLSYPLRWYDGVRWTEHVVDQGRRMTDPGGAPTAGGPPGDDEEARWLPPPGFPEMSRWGPFAVGVPTGGPGAVPEGGYEPVLTGNRALDLTQNYINEFESQLRRDASLLRSSVVVLRGSPALKRLALALGILVLGAFLLILAVTVTLTGVRFLGGSEADPFALFFVAVLLLVVVLPGVYVLSSVAAFAVGVAGALSILGSRLRSAVGLLRDVGRARGALWALVLARLGWWAPGMTTKAGAALYEAFAVFAAPAAMDDRVPLKEAQRRSEELVASRWGPGRFRALGLPRTNPWSIVYSRGVTKYGYKAPYIAAATFLALLLGPLLVALAIGDPTWILVAFGWMWGSLAIGAFVWGAAVQPLLQGVLRAYLYHYAKTGVALAPYEEPALHACLREEARATFGLPQRRSGRGRTTPVLGLGGVVRSFAADPSGYAQAEAGITGGDVRSVLTDARRLYKDGRLVTGVLKRSGPTHPASLVAATGLPPDRCRVAVVNLVWAGKVRADVTSDGDVRYSLAT